MDVHTPFVHICHNPDEILVISELVCTQSAVAKLITANIILIKAAIAKLIQIRFIF